MPRFLLQVVLLVDQSLERQQAWDTACTACGTAFYSAASRGACTYLFANLHQHTFTPLVSGSTSQSGPPSVKSCCCKDEMSCLSLALPVLCSFCPGMHDPGNSWQAYDLLCEHSCPCHQAGTSSTHAFASHLAKQGATQRTRASPVQKHMSQHRRLHKAVVTEASAPSNDLTTAAPTWP